MKNAVGHRAVLQIANLKCCGLVVGGEMSVILSEEVVREANKRESKDPYCQQCLPCA